MTASDILARLTPHFREILRLPDLTLTPDMEVRGMDEWDSLNHLRLIAATEKEFGIRISHAEIETLHNMGDWAAMIARKAGA